MSEFLCLSPYRETAKWHSSFYPHSTVSSDIHLFQILGEGLGISLWARQLPCSQCLALKWMINKKKDQYMMSGKGSVTTKNKGRQGERGTEKGEGCFEKSLK